MSMDEPCGQLLERILTLLPASHELLEVFGFIVLNKTAGQHEGPLD